MTTDSQRVGGRPLAFRWVEAAVRAGDGVMVVEDDDVDAIPSGSARLAMLQLSAFAGLVMQRLAALEGRDSVALLLALWPAEEDGA